MEYLKQQTRMKARQQYLRTSAERQADFDKRQRTEFREVQSRSSSLSIKLKPTNAESPVGSQVHLPQSSAHPLTPTKHQALNLPPREKMPSLEAFACRTGRHFRVQDLVIKSQTLSSRETLEDEAAGEGGDTARLMAESEGEALKLKCKPQDVLEKKRNMTINLLLQRQNELIEKTRLSQRHLEQRQQQNVSNAKAAVALHRAYSSESSRVRTEEKNQQKHVVSLSEMIQRPGLSGREPAFLVMEEANESDDSDKIVPAESILSKLNEKNRLNVKVDQRFRLPSLGKDQNGSNSQRDQNPLVDLSPRTSLPKSLSNYQLGVEPPPSRLKSRYPDSPHSSTALSSERSDQAKKDKRAKHSLRYFPGLKEQNSLKLLHHGKDFDGLEEQITGNNVYRNVKTSLDVARKKGGYQTTRQTKAVKRSNSSQFFIHKGAPPRHSRDMPSWMKKKPMDPTEFWVGGEPPAKSSAKGHHPNAKQRSQFELCSIEPKRSKPLIYDQERYHNKILGVIQNKVQPQKLRNIKFLKEILANQAGHPYLDDHDIYLEDQESKF